MNVTNNANLDNQCGNRKNQEQNFTVQEKIEERQHQVYDLRLQGFSNQEIADKLGVSISTIEKDVHEIKNNWTKLYAKLQGARRFKAFLHTCEHLELVQKELWTKYKDEKDPIMQLKILGAIKETAIDQTKIFDENAPWTVPSPEQWKKMLDSV